MRFARQRKKRVLWAVVHVDFNPARAAMCDTLVDSDHMSIQRRLMERDGFAVGRVANKTGSYKRG